MPPSSLIIIDDDDNDLGSTRRGRNNDDRAVFFDDSETKSPTSSWDVQGMQAEVKRADLQARLDQARRVLKQDTQRFQNQSSSQHAKMLREESELVEETTRFESELHQACDHAIALRVKMARVEEEAQIRHLKWQVRILNLKLLECILQDPDCQDIYSESSSSNRVLPRTQLFNKFSQCQSLDDWIGIKRKLEWIEKVLVISNEELAKCEEARDEKRLTEILEVKGEAIHRYNDLNDIRIQTQVV